MTNPTAEGEEGLRHEPAPADGPWSKVRGPLAAGSIAVALVWAVANVANSPTETDTKHKQGESGQQQSSDCTATHPCLPSLRPDGSTEVVQGKSGYGICFDSSYWVNLPRLGYHITYEGVEKKYECTREDVLAGKCGQTSFDAFRFVPEAGVSLPKYWFAPSGSTC